MLPPQTWFLTLLCLPRQSLQNKSYNHFAAIYYLLVERLKAHRCSFPVEQRLDARQRRPSTIAEQTVVKVSQASESRAQRLASSAPWSKLGYSHLHVRTGQTQHVRLLIQTRSRLHLHSFLYSLDLNASPPVPLFIVFFSLPPASPPWHWVVSLPLICISQRQFRSSSIPS